MAEELKKRSEIPEELKWDTSLIFKTEEEMLAALEQLRTDSKKIQEKYKGKLTDAKTINECIRDYNAWIINLDHVSSYADLNSSVDYTDEKALAIAGKVGVVLSREWSALSFIATEINNQEEAVLKEAVETATLGKTYLKDILRNKPHQLSAETEAVLAALAGNFRAPENIYNQTKLSDMKFEDFEANGTMHPLGYAMFEDDYEYDRDTKVRRAAFDAFSSKLRDYMNTTAAVYSTQVSREKTIANVRHFDSVFDYLLFDQKVSRELYDRQIDLIMEHLAPHMRKYARLLKEAHGLDKMTYADLKITLDPDYDPKVTIEQSRDYILDGLAIMGKDYQEMLKEAYEKRWIDFAKNVGKCTGGFCAGPYQKNAFILLSWNERMSDVFTLAHELGHAGHFKAAQAGNSYMDWEPSRYAIEAPSTINELLMAEYLKEKSGDDKRFRRWVLASQISNTYYHNFVTHLLEAAYQREVYKKIDAGETVSADTLNAIYKDVLKKFWGDEIELTDGCELTWMRQPHYYMGLYSYCYSASLTIATQVMKRIRKEGESAVEDWKKTLAAGGTVDPVEFAKMAGVDITTDAALLDTIDYIGSIIDEIEELNKEI